MGKIEIIKRPDGDESYQCPKCLDVFTDKAQAQDNKNCNHHKIEEN